MYEEILRGITVLYAEDDPIMLASMTNTLSLLVERVLPANNGAEAIKTFNCNTTHIVILDIDMPIINGLDVAMEIRKIDKNVPIFILTNYEDTNNLRQAVKLNLVDFLTKPIDFYTLKRTLEECIKRLDENGRLFVAIDENLCYNIPECAIYKNGEKILLNKKEATLFEMLIKKKGVVIPYETIENIIGNYATRDAVKSSMARLRKKVGKEYIKNVWEIGYFLV